MTQLISGPCDEAIIRSDGKESPCAVSSRRWVLTAAILGSSMAFIDSTAVNVALPVIQEQLHASVMGAQWIVESYALFLSSLLLVGGALGDRLGRRRVFLTGVVIFGLSSLACGLAQNVPQLVIARAVQGIGGALLTPGSLALISAAFPAGERGRAIGTWSASTAITTAIGPVLGGWLAQSLTWRAVFWINLPLAVVVICIGIWKVPESRQPDAPPLDFIGAALVTLALGAIVLGLILAGGRGLRDPIALWAIVIGAATFASFVIVEQRIAHPMLPLALFRSKSFAGVNAITLLLYTALAGSMFFLAFDLIQAQGLTPAGAGAALLPLILLMSTLSRWSGGLLDRVGPRLPLSLGPAIASIGFALLAIPSTHASYWSGFLPGIAVFGLGMAVTVAPLTTVVMNSVSASQGGLASGVNNAVARVGSLLAVAVLGLLVTTTFTRSLDRRLAASALADVAPRIPRDERLKLGSAHLPADLTADQLRRAREAIAGSVADSFRIVTLVSAALAALAGTIGYAVFKTSPSSLGGRASS